MSDALHAQSLKSLSHALHTKQVSAVALATHFISRIEQHDSQLNSFITVDKPGAMRAAEAADKRLSEGGAPPLTGIPFAQKDIFCTQGMLTSCGSKMLANFVAPYDATVVSRCHKAGLVMLGKTNMDEFAMGSTNENSFYGPVKNPWDLNTVSGGSSGGSASAVAAGLVPLATGTDTGGSIRQPAAFCGITGLKPTYGRVSRYGMVAFASSLDQGGPMAKSAEDCAWLMNVMAGVDEKDATSVDVPVPDYTKGLDTPLKGLTIGLPKQFFHDDVDRGIARCVDEAIAVYQSLGATVKTVDLPHIEHGTAAYYVIAPAECSSNLARFDGVRYGYRCPDPTDLTDLYKRSRATGFGVEVKRRIMMGTYALSSGYYEAYYRKAQQIRQLIFNDFQQALAEVDVIMGPTTASLAFPLGETIDDPIRLYLQDAFTLPVNLAGLPAMSIPVGFEKGLPVGLQLIGNAFREDTLLQVAHQFQQHTAWHTTHAAHFF